MSTISVTEIQSDELLSRIYEPAWLRSHSPHVLVRFYLIPFEVEGDFVIPGLDGGIGLFGQTPFRVNVADIEKKEAITKTPWLVRRTSAQHEVWVEEFKRILPTATYVLVSMPIEGGGSDYPLHYRNASQKLDALVGALRAYGGNNLLRELVYECGVDVSTPLGAETIASKFIPYAAPCEGPFADKVTWEGFSKVAAALDDSLPPIRARMLAAFGLIETAAQKQGREKFFNYWIALEVAANTDSTAKILRLLSDSYGERSNVLVQNRLGFERIKNVRNDVFHNGASIDLSPAFERYIHCMLLDVVHARLKLPCLRLMEREVDAGFDLQHICVDQDLSIGE